MRVGSKKVLTFTAVVVMAVQALVGVAVPVSAAASEDTYAWVKHIGGEFGCPENQFTPHAIATSGTRVYIYDQPNKRIDIMTSGGTSVGHFGSSGAGNGQLLYVYGIAADRQQNVYVIDRGYDPAISSVRARVQKFDSSGQYLSTFGSYGTGPGQFQYPVGLAVDSSGNTFVLADNKVQKFDSNGSFVTAFGTPGTGPGQFYAAYAITVDAADNVGVIELDGSNSSSRVQKFTNGGTYIAEFGSYGTGTGQFTSILGLASDNSSNYYVLEPGRIQKFTDTGTYVATFGTQGSGNGEFMWPRGLAADSGSAGSLYVADTNNHRIASFALDGTWQANFVYQNPNLPVKEDICSLEDIARDSAGNLYVTDSGWKNIKVYSPAGALLRTIGASVSDGGQLAGPVGLDVASDGKIYVADSGANGQIVVYDANGQYLSSISTKGSAIDNFEPSDVVAVQDGIYIVSRIGYGVSGPEGNRIYNGYLKKFSYSGTELWAKIDSTGAAMYFYDRVIAASGGGVVVTDVDSSVVRSYDAGGAQTLQFGSTGTGDGQFSYDSPTGIAQLGSGSFLVNDSAFNAIGRVQKFNASGSYLS